MPYRRLPNTDAARIRAMKVALAKGKELPPNKVAFSSKTIIKLQKLLPAFENTIKFNRNILSSQNKNCRDYNEIVKKARLYLSHFLRVMNMAIFRSDLPAETRAYYGLPTNELNIPSLNTENELVIWGKRIIEGEESRIRKGGSPITNPTIAVVKVRYRNYLEALSNHQTLIKNNLEYIHRLTDLRREVDEIILQLWNEVENTYRDLPDERKKAECEDYGLVYFYRKNELTRADKADVLNNKLA